MRSLIVLLSLAAAAGLHHHVAQAQSYDGTMAMSALYYCKAAYCDAANIAGWGCGSSCDYHSQFTLQNVYHNESTGSQGFTGYDGATSQIIVSFRGSSDIENWIHNLDFIKTAYPYASCNCEVHRGFLETYQAIQPQLISDVQTLVQQYPSSQILVTGHSLGAAVSLLCALDIVNLGISTNVVVYNFGQPRVGGPDFAAWAAGTLPMQKQFRVTHSADPVPHVPPEIMGFLATYHEEWYDNDLSTGHTDCQDSATAEDPNCCDSQVPTLDIADHLLYLGHCTECDCGSGAQLNKVARLREAFNRSKVGQLLAARGSMTKKKTV